MGSDLQKQSTAWRDYLIFVACSLLYFYPFLRTLPRVSDEGILIVGAERVVQGQIPYRDFFEGMGPGTFYWLAAYFRVWGVTWLATRIDLLVTSASTALVLYYLSRRIKLRYPVLPVVLFFGTAYGLLWPAVNHHADSNLLALIGFTTLLIWLERRLWPLLLLAGVLAGLATCFLQPKGVLLFGAFFLTVWILTRKEGGVIWRLMILAGGYVAVLAGAAGYFWYKHALWDLIFDTITFPMAKYTNINHVPYGMGLFSFYGHRWSASLNEAFSPAVGYPVSALLIIPFLFVASLPVILVVLGAWQRQQAFTQEAVPYWLTGFAIWFGEMHRRDIMHLVYGAPLLLILCFFLVQKQANARAGHWLAPLCVLAASLAVFNFLVVSTAQTRIETRRGAGYSYQKNQVLELLESHIKPGEEIFAYPYRPLYYFLLNAPNATRYSFFMPGYHTDAQFQEVIDDLERKKISHVLWDTSFEDGSMAWAFPNKPKQPPLLEPYLQEHYTMIDSRQGVRLMERKPAFR